MSSLAAQEVKEPVLSLWRLRLLWRHWFDPWPQEFLHAMGTAKKKKKRRRKEKRRKQAQ